MSGAEDPSIDDLLGSYESALQRITALPELPMRRAALSEAVEALDPEQCCWWIDQLVRGALWGHEPEMDAMLALADWLIRLEPNADYERFQSLYRAAAEAERESVLMLLRNPPPHAALRKGARLPEVRLPMERDVTMGERRSLARGRDRRLIDRLLQDPNQLVISNLLDNPALTVTDVIVIVSRRPTTPDLVWTAALKPRWFKEFAVREAVVQNPYAETGLALKLLPTLGVQVLRRIRDASDLHPIVHEAAGVFVRLREERTAPWRV